MSCVRSVRPGPGRGSPAVARCARTGLGRPVASRGV
jgi:hypothetical protein